MDLSQLQTFLVLAREGHMTRAASKLHLTQPAVSVQLARLEEDLGYALFDRTSKGLVLTEAGATFLVYAEQALGRLEDGRTALEEMAGLKRGSLSIGGGATATTYLLPPLLGKFHEVYPGIRFFVREQPSQSVVEDVLQGRLDLGVVTLPIKTPSGSLGATKLEIEHWVDDELRLLVPKQHRLVGREVFEWEALDGEALVLFEAGSAVRGLIDSRIHEAGINVDIVMELRSIDSIKQMVAQGIGSAFVSQYALRPGDESLRCAQDPIRRELAILYRSDRSQSAAARAFLEMMR
jgi:DNA-binding transcriptional LysR family regulator